MNSMDVDIDENCMRLLALQAPAARDLRFVTTAMKISTELERMSDLAENICERVIELNEEPQLKPYIDIPRMANWTMQMVREALMHLCVQTRRWHGKSVPTTTSSII